MINVSTKVEVSTSTNYDDMNGDTEYLKWQTIPERGVGR